jgi:hypothetical protein
MGVVTFIEKQVIVSRLQIGEDDPVLRELWGALAEQLEVRASTGTVDSELEGERIVQPEFEGEHVLLSATYYLHF